VCHKSDTDNAFWIKEIGGSHLIVKALSKARLPCGA
jgi:hypothetical protein